MDREIMKEDIAEAYKRELDGFKEIIAPLKTSAIALELEEKPFEYGWCYTDHKDGKSVGGTRSEKFYEYSEMVDFIEETLANYGLPMPKADEIFHGTDENLLFVNSHGVVVRIGPKQNIEDCVNPAIVQPLHWIKDEASGCVISIYPGMDIYQSVNHSNIAPSWRMGEAMNFFGNNSVDDHWNNKGYIPVIVDDEGTEKMLEIQLDPSARYDGPRKDKIDVNVPNSLSLRDAIDSLSQAARKKSEEKRNKSKINNGKSLKTDFNIELYRQAFDYHAPLRRAFALAFDADSPIKDKRRAKRLAWKMAQYFHDRGYQIWGHPSSRLKISPEKRDALIAYMKDQLGFENKKKEDRSKVQRELLQTRRLKSPWKEKPKN